MIGISKLYCGTVEPSDVLRYQRRKQKLPSHLLQFGDLKRPVVVWNCTRRCNLRCRHCYSGSASGCTSPDQLSTREGEALLRDLADFGSPVVLFSGGEPFMRKDLFDLAELATGLGMRAVISTNGTLITEEVAGRLAGIGLSYVGVSLDGVGQTHDTFRGVDGTFERAIRGINNCLEAGLKVGVRFTITQSNVIEIPDVFALMRREGIPRACFYHLVYTGRGQEIVSEDLSHRGTRDAVDTVIDHTAAMYEDGLSPEVLTVDNHADGPYLYLRMKRENSPRAPQVLELLRANGGNSSGHGIGCVSWDGRVHPDQFWRHLTLGNVREKPFSEIWTDTSVPIVAKLKNKREYVTGRCAECRFLDTCGGNCRPRAEALTGDRWAPDPACYLTDEEIGLEG